MNIGDAIEHLQSGKSIRRDSWGTHRKFIFRQIPATIGKDVVPKMQSLPTAVKDYFNWTFESDNESAIYYNDQIAEVQLSNLIVAYTPSVSDLFATDWRIVE